MRGKPLIFSRESTGNRGRVKKKREAEELSASNGLPKNPPSELKGMREARRAWRTLMRAENRLPGKVFNDLDLGFLIGYCLAVQARQRALELEAAASNKFRNGEIDLAALIKVRVELRQSIRLVSDLEKQLYGTPRARGGVTTPAKEIDPMELELERIGNMLDES